MIKEIHKMKTKIVTIVDPAIRIEQEYETFINGIGLPFLCDNKAKSFI